MSRVLSSHLDFGRKVCTFCKSTKCEFFQDTVLMDCQQHKLLLQPNSLFVVICSSVVEKLKKSLLLGYLRYSCKQVFNCQSLCFQRMYLNGSTLKTKLFKMRCEALRMFVSFGMRCFCLHPFERLCGLPYKILLFVLTLCYFFFVIYLFIYLVQRDEETNCECIFLSDSKR